MSNKTKEEIIEYIKKHGFILEEEIKNILEKNGWDVESSAHFADQDTGESREIDLVSTNVIRRYNTDLDAYIHLRIDLVIQCKNIIEPLLFLATTKSINEITFWNDRVFFHPCYKYIYLPSDNSKKSFRVLHLEEFLAIQKLHHFFEGKRKVVNFVIMPQKETKKDKKEIYKDVIVDFIKAIDSRNKEMGRHIKILSKEGKNTWIYPFGIIVPILILAKEFSEIYYNEGNFEIQSCDYLQMITNYTSKTVSGTFQFDIVNKNSFEKYLQEKINSTIKNVYESISQNIIPIKNFGKN